MLVNFSTIITLAVAATNVGAQTCSSFTVRKSWFDHDEFQKQAYLSAVQALKKLPPTGRGVLIAYDDFQEIHLAQIAQVHGTAQFLPWHRWLLKQYEGALQKVSNTPNLTVPYLNWGKEGSNNLASNPHLSSIFSPKYIGTKGSAADNYCLRDGVAANWHKWYLTPASRPLRPSGECSRRQWNGGNAINPIEADSYSTTLWNRTTYTSFIQFSKALEAGALHASVHVNVAGTNGDMIDPGLSINDPIFFLHHANVDRIWTLWQNSAQGGPFRNTYGGNRENNAPTATNALRTDALAGSLSKTQIQYFLNSENITNCIKYQEPKLTMTRLVSQESSPLKPLQTIPESWFMSEDMLQINREEQRKYNDWVAEQNATK